MLTEARHGINTTTANHRGILIMKPSSGAEAEGNLFLIVPELIGGGEENSQTVSPP
jgi:hypothetical protein